MNYKNRCFRSALFNCVRRFGYICLGLVLLSLSWLQASENPDEFNFSKLNNWATGRIIGKIKNRKQLAVRIGVNGDGKVVYVVGSFWIPDARLEVVHHLSKGNGNDLEVYISYDGKRLPPPCPSKNFIVMSKDAIQKGHMKPIDVNVFYRFLSQTDEFSLIALNRYLKSNGPDSK